jgi:acyl carrier protein
MTTMQRLQRLVASKLAIDEKQLTRETRLESLGIDSLAMLELMFEIEDAFGIRFAEHEPRVLTLGDLAARVDRELAKEVHQPQLQGSPS